MKHERAIQQYKEGKLSISGAAKNAGITLWDFQELLVQKGFVSDYSLENLQEELELLKKKK